MGRSYFSRCRGLESPLLSFASIFLSVFRDPLLGDLRKYLAARLVSLSALCKLDVSARSIELVEHKRPLHRIRRVIDPSLYEKLTRRAAKFNDISTTSESRLITLQNKYPRIQRIHLNLSISNGKDVFQFLNFHEFKRLESETLQKKRFYYSFNFFKCTYMLFTRDMNII